MDVEPDLSSSDAMRQVAWALASAGFDVREGTPRMGFPYTLRVARPPEERQAEVWAIVKGIDPDAIPVHPPSPWTHG